MQQVPLAQLLFNPLQLCGNALEQGLFGVRTQGAGQYVPAVGLHFQHRMAVFVIPQKIKTLL